MTSPRGLDLAKLQTFLGSDRPLTATMFAGEIRKHDPEFSFEVPEGITFAEIDRDTGKLALPTCPRTYNESFITGTEPGEYCELHRW